MLDVDQKALEAAATMHDHWTGRATTIGSLNAVRNTKEIVRAYLAALPSGAEPVACQPDIITMLRDKVAEAIRGDGSDLSDTPWETLSADRRIGWLGDADRALSVVKDYLTSTATIAASPLSSSQVTEAMVERATAAYQSIPGSHTDGMRAALTAALYPVKGDGWTLIETAKQDGKDQIVWDGDRTYIASWDEHGWWVLAEFEVHPTHWCPLPTPPARP